jgi:putative redox protein
MQQPEALSPLDESTAAEAGSWVTCHVGQTGFQTDIAARSHRLTGDEPTDVGGTDAGPTPYEFLLMALGGCTAMTLRIYADRKGWPLQQATVSVRQARAHKPDCEICEIAAVGVERIERKIELVGPLTAEQRMRLMSVADRCPVQQTLDREISVETTQA